jgi:hypothetical protein
MKYYIKSEIYVLIQKMYRYFPVDFKNILSRPTLYIAAVE